MKYTFLLLILAILYSCNNHQRKSDEIMREFDSVNQSLKKINSSVFSEQMYDSLMRLAVNDTATLDLHNELLGFHIYLDEMREGFCKAAGDSSGVTIPVNRQDDIEFTNRFFKAGPVLYLFPTLSRLREFTSDTTLIKNIDRFEADNDDDVVKKYFRNAPPIAVFTMLNFFEQKIKEITFEVLREHFKTR